jgi:hypothetical protein
MRSSGPLSLHTNLYNGETGYNFNVALYYTNAFPLSVGPLGTRDLPRLPTQPERILGTHRIGCNTCCLGM